MCTQSIKKNNTEQKVNTRQSKNKKKTNVILDYKLKNLQSRVERRASLFGPFVMLNTFWDNTNNQRLCWQCRLTGRACERERKEKNEGKGDCGVNCRLESLEPRCHNWLGIHMHVNKYLHLRLISICNYITFLKEEIIDFSRDTFSMILITS